MECGARGRGVSGMADAVALANRQQGLASDPDVSAFVSASAGSGKTKLLIDRLLRLMLPRVVPDDPERRLVAGTDPARIQCLTFTKAAAAEMSIRLQRELGRWVTLDDASLDRRLAGLGCDGGAGGAAALRQPARALFARVLDLPGGMRIGTIHAFCQSLLRRFPVEAAVSPHFRLVEETDSRVALNRAWEEVLAARAAAPEGDALSLLAGQVGAAEAVRLVARLQGKAPLLAPAMALLQRDPDAVEAALRGVAGIGHADEAACILAAARLPDEAGMRRLLGLAMEVGTPALKRKAEQIASWLALPHPDRAAAWDEWRALFLTGSGEPRASKGFVSGKLAESRPEIAAALVAEAERVAAVEDQRRAIRMVALTMALLRLAGPVLGRYADTKRARGLVDYDDLIARTLMLLADPGSAWVLYKLDGGIDHLLLDEVQDTSDLQWRIAGALTEEFFVGRGAEQDRDRTLPRTVFAVGDYKQSIYSFQGADPQAFHDWHLRFRDRVRSGGGGWREPELTVSFRSTVPVLALVDQVFANPDAARGVVEPGSRGRVRHDSARPDAPGCVELWPLVPAALPEADGSGPRAPDQAAPADADDPWSAPSRNRGQASAPQRLAEALARWIAGEVGRVHETGGAPLLPGDVLVLVPRRSPFVRALIRALKAEGVPVATLVRTGLVDQIAVQDLLALCDVLLLPGDDLSLGCVLTSPIGGLSDDSLMALAVERGGRSLWEQLRARADERPDWQAAWHILSTLFARVDYVSPHALLSEALGRLGGRARLLRRLGPEAAEPVDELLSAALRHAETHPPSLQGFLHWLRRSEETVRREPDSAGDAVRVMTAHGAKGLQARLVVLPDTIAVPPTDENLLWSEVGGDSQEDAMALPFWVPRAELGSVPTRRLRDRIRAAAEEESNRLLYVALTRAADRLVVCGWEPGRKPGGEPPPGAWYPLCRKGFEAAGAAPRPFALGWAGEMLVLQHSGVAEPALLDAPAAAPGALPSWIGRAPSWQAGPPPSEPPLPRPLAPSRPDDVGLGPVPALRSPLDATGRGRGNAFRRGRLVHRLLQHLHELPSGRQLMQVLQQPVHQPAAPERVPPATARRVERRAQRRHRAEPDIVRPARRQRTRQGRLRRRRPCLPGWRAADPGRQRARRRRRRIQERRLRNTAVLQHQHLPGPAQRERARRRARRLEALPAQRVPGPRRRLAPGLAPRLPAAHHQPVRRPGQGDVEQPVAFLLRSRADAVAQAPGRHGTELGARHPERQRHRILLRIAAHLAPKQVLVGGRHRNGVRQHHQPRLQPLGAVRGHHPHRVAGGVRLASHRFLRPPQPVQEPLQRRRMGFGVAQRRGQQLVHRLGRFRPQPPQQPGPAAQPAQRLAQQRVRRHVVDAREQGRQDMPRRLPVRPLVRPRAQLFPQRPAAALHRQRHQAVVGQPADRAGQHAAERQVVARQQQHVAQRQQVLHRDLVHQPGAHQRRHRHPFRLERPDQRAHERRAARHQHQHVARQQRRAAGLVHAPDLACDPARQRFRQALRRGRLAAVARRRRPRVVGIRRRRLVRRPRAGPVRFG